MSLESLRNMDANKQNSDAKLVAIVDDDASVRVSTRRLLRWSGLRAEAFGSAEEFLGSGFLRQTSCLLLDVRMPGMDGLELQRRLTEVGQRIPIVFLSARASEEEETRALRAGAAAFLRKPVSKEALLSAIQSTFEPTAGNNNNKPLNEL
jgi:FixJ family two-component response regulator